MTHAPDTAYEPLTRYYDDKQVANITHAIALMNAWNRVAVGSIRDPCPTKTNRETRLIVEEHHVILEGRAADAQFIGGEVWVGVADCHAAQDRQFRRD